ncbi:MAG: hypothetical protein JKX85_06550 [Phycisphaeraceae bacterium]|nr:hypothetical protein [Phycisphaeraceae bacterium]
MTQQKKKSLIQVDVALRQAKQGSVNGDQSVDLIDLGCREDIDWQAEGQRVLEMLNDPASHGNSSKPHAA